MTGPTVRTLIRVPILHTEVDLGELGESVREVHVQKGGELQWEERSRAVDEFWNGIRKAVLSMELPYEQLRLYQDGLPYCGHEEQIVRDLAEAGSANHQILLDLVAKGARLTGTEDPQLLLIEYELIRETLAHPTAGSAPHVVARRHEQSKRILRQRDQYIARRIDETLIAVETGLIFLGMLHSLDDFLPRDIEVRCVGSALLLGAGGKRGNDEGDDE